MPPSIDGGHPTSALLADLCRSAARPRQTDVAEEPLAIPFEIFGGAQDGTVERSELEEWRNHSQASVSVQTFPGNHFYLQQSSKSVTDAIVRKLQGS